MILDVAFAPLTAIFKPVLPAAAAVEAEVKFRIAPVVNPSAEIDYAAAVVTLGAAIVEAVVVVPVYV